MKTLQNKRALISVTFVLPHTYFFDHTRTWRASPDEETAQCRGHLRDITNIKDAQSFQQSEYERMTAK